MNAANCDAVIKLRFQIFLIHSNFTINTILGVYGNETEFQEAEHFIFKIQINKHTNFYNAIRKVYSVFLIIICIYVLYNSGLLKLIGNQPEVFVSDLFFIC